MTTMDKPARLIRTGEDPSGTARESTGWRTAIASTLGLTVGPSVLTVMSFGAFIAPLHREFGWGVSDIGLAASLLSVTVMIISPLQGYLVDRYGGRRLILWSSPVFGLSLMAMYFLPGDLSVFYLAWALIPVCGLGLWPVSYLRLTAGWFERKLGFALGIANSGIGVGTVLVPILTAWLIGAFGWRAAFVGLGAVALLAFPVAFFFITEPSPRKTDVQTGGDTLKISARRRPFWLILGAFLLLGLVGSSITVYQIPLLLDAGVPESIANLVPVALGLALIVARVATGWLLDRFSASVVMSFNLAGGLVSVLLFAAGPNVVTGLIAAALAGLLIGSEFDVLSYLVPRHFGRMAYGKIYGIAFSAFQIGGAIASSAVSASRDSYGSYTPAMLTLAVVCVICAGFFMCLGPYRYDTVHG
ncbi:MULTISPECIES: MFS transporter [unclassified Streptomyces]|uniref:MFS transporter n=1 Tax=unclassified Streptomyces TaxID=2593676 RepID=UPI0009391C3C|nr:MULTISPECIES: MFS transporter [unclassified Streptomyces]